MNKVKRKKIDTIPNQLAPLGTENLPVITAEDYQERINELFKAGNNEYTHYVVYGDREHFSNIEYFTGIDPRFEEALLVLPKDNKPSIIVGDEGCDYSQRIPYPIDIMVYHAFSLPQQPRRTNTILNKLLSESGLDYKSKVGVIGWKYFDVQDFDDEGLQFDLPMFIYNELVKVCGVSNLSNVTSFMIDNETGLRCNLDEKEFILSEFAGTKSSRATLKVLQNLREGISELEASSFLEIDGDPLSVHANVNFNDNYYYALASPMHNNKLKKGDVVGAGMAYRRSLCHKVGIYIDDESDLEPERRKVAEETYKKYFEIMKLWYETIGEGVTGGEVVEKVEKVIGSTTNFGISLNLGHVIHTDEWTNTPFYNDSVEKLHSGMSLQCDFTTAYKDENVAVHAEDGVLIANEAMRSKIKELAPEAYGRIEARRDFMINVLGIKIKDEILPTSDLAGIIFPFLGDLETVLVYEE